MHGPGHHCFSSVTRDLEISGDFWMGSQCELILTHGLQYKQIELTGDNGL